MSSALYDGTEAEPVRVQGSIDERNVARYEVEYIGKTQDEAMARRKAEWEGYALTRTRVERQGGAWHVTGTYEGIAVGSPSQSNPKKTTADDAVYELDVTHAQQPIQSHPLFEDLKTKYGWEELPDGGGYGFPKKVPGKKGPATGQSSTGGALSQSGERRAGGASEMYGVTQWLDVGAVWRKTWAKAHPLNPQELQSIFRNLGRIDTPEGDPPQMPDNRNWLRSKVSKRDRGNCTEFSIEWTLSGRGGWQPDIYATKARAQ